MEENALGTDTGSHDSSGLDLNYSLAAFYFCAPTEFCQSFCASLSLYVEGSNGTYLQSKMRRTCQKQVSSSDTLHVPLLTLVYMQLLLTSPDFPLHTLSPPGFINLYLLSGFFFFFFTVEDLVESLEG